ncbi:MAG: dihydropteroate synthase [Clostridia bacterium]|nr:dihydropteroate synthase [Clostridia bacterium]
MKSLLVSDKWTFERLNFDRPRVMGILNLTPDSFYDGGYHSSYEALLRQAEKMIAEGADLIDMGAYSTRPAAAEITTEEEWNRLKNILLQFRKRFPQLIISVDTFRSEIARRAISEGADIINDISGGQLDPDIFRVVATHGTPYIMMHIQGTPATMQINPQYIDVVNEINDFFQRQLNTLKNEGVEKNILLDPGFGFGKTVEHNYRLLHGLRKFAAHGFPLVAGVSRKSMINKVLGTTPAAALNGTTAANMLALINGANLLRVHDVKEAKETIKLYCAYRENGEES